MEPEELLEFQKIFASVDTSDPLSLRDWFESYPDLTPSEQRQVINRTKRGVARLKHMAKVTGITFVELDNCIRIKERKFTNLPDPWPPRPKKPLPDIDIPDDWAARPEWVHHCVYDLKITRNQLTVLLGCSFTKIKNLLAKHADTGLPQDVINFINEL
jgi:hypothetical protein